MLRKMFASLIRKCSHRTANFLLMVVLALSNIILMVILLHNHRLSMRGESPIFPSNTGELPTSEINYLSPKSYLLKCKYFCADLCKTQSKTPTGVKNKTSMRKSENKIDSNYLLHLHSLLIEVWRYSRGDKARKTVHLAIDVLEEIIGSKPKPVMPFNDKIKKSKYICPEIYKGTKWGAPFFHNGFEIANCTIRKSIASFFSILIDSSRMLEKDIDNIVNGIRNKYKLVSVYVSCYKKDLENFIKKFRDSRLKFITHEPTATTGEIWKELLVKSNTEFVLIARDVLLFDEFDARIERLIRVIDELGVAAAAGARRNVKDGLWDKGCYQSALKNYTLSYQEGYDRSAVECLFCDYVTGPFVIRRSTLLDVDLKPLQGDAFFRHMFLTLQLKNQESIVCPDSMFYTKDYLEETNYEKKFWMPFAQNHYLNRIKFNFNNELHFNCDESNVNCIPRLQGGLAHPPCCLEQLSYIVGTIMQICEKARIICELQSGVMMGSVKFNKVLPWEWDVDMTILTANFSILKDYNDEFRKAGFPLEFKTVPEGEALAYYKNKWKIELFGRYTMDSQVLIQRGLTPTRLLYNGMKMNVPKNPGLYARNRYGRFNYGHIEHWSILKNNSDEWITYLPNRFRNCNSLRTHDCLDQYFTDGSIQFNDVIP